MKDLYSVKYPVANDKKRDSAFWNGILESIACLLKQDNIFRFVFTAVC